MIQKLLVSCRKHITSMLQLQIFLSIISLPFLIGWGLPLSLFTLLGNIFFIPFFTVFLFISSLFFFAVLCSLPLTFLSWLLEQLCQIWLWFLQYGQKTWLLALSTQHLFLFIVLALCLVIHCVQLPFSLEHACMYSILTAGALLFAHYTSLPSCTRVSITCAQRHLDAYIDHHQVTLVDPSNALGTLKNSEAWITYTLVPLLNRLCGTFLLTIIVPCPTSTTYHVLEKLLFYCHIDKIYIGGDPATLPTSLSQHPCVSSLSPGDTHILSCGRQHFKIQQQTKSPKNGKRKPLWNIRLVATS